MVESQRMLGAKLSEKHLCVYLPNATTHHPEKLRKYLSQPFQWILALYELGSGTIIGRLFFSRSFFKAPTMLILSNIFLHAYSFKLTAGIVGRLTKS